MNDLLLGVLGSVPLLAMGLGGTIGVLGAALALGIRHGIDWETSPRLPTSRALRQHPRTRQIAAGSTASPR